MRQALRDIAINVGATAVSRGLLIAALPIITHQFDPSEVGLWPVVLSLAVVVAPLTSLRFDIAIPLASGDREAAVVAHIMTLVLCAGMVPVTAICLCLPDVFRFLTGTEVDLALRAMVPAQFVSIGLLLITSAWLIRSVRYAHLAASNMVTAITTVALLVVLPRQFGATTMVLLCSVVGGHVAGTLVTIAGAMRNGWRPLAPQVSLSECRQVLSKFRKYPLLSVPYSISQMLVERGLPLLIASSFGLAAAGVHHLLRQAFFAPITILAIALRQVVFGHASAQPTLDAQRDLYTRMALPVLVAVPAVTAFVAHFVLAWLINLLGASWGQAVTVAPAMLVHAGSLAITAWMDRVFDLRNRQGLALTMQVISDVIVFGCLAACILIGWQFAPVVWAASFMAAAYNIIWLGVVFWLLGHRKLTAIGLALLPVAVLALFWAAFSALSVGVGGFAGLSTGVAVLVAVVIATVAWTIMQARQPRGGM